MADITLSIPDDKVDRVIHALCVNHDPHMEETGANAKLVLFEHLKKLVLRVERQEAAVTAQALIVEDDFEEVTP